MGNNLITDSGNVDVYFTRFKSYVALLTQEGTSDPTAIVLNADDSSFLGEIVWTRAGVGYYIGTLEGQLITNKTICYLSNSNSPAVGLSVLDGEDNNTVTLNTGNILAVPLLQDGKLYRTSIRIDVYQS